MFLFFSFDQRSLTTEKEPGCHGGKLPRYGPEPFVGDERKQIARCEEKVAWIGCFRMTFLREDVLTSMMFAVKFPVDLVAAYGGCLKLETLLFEDHIIPFSRMSISTACHCDFRS